MKYIIVLLCFIASLARAEYVDLSKEKVIAYGECEMGKKVFPCLAVNHNSKVYLVLFDRRGEAFHIIVDKEGNAEVVWSRDSV